MRNIFEDLAAEYWTICQLVNQEEMIDDDFQAMVDAQEHFYEIFFYALGDPSYTPEKLNKIEDKLINAREIGYKKWAKVIVNRMGNYYITEFDSISGVNISYINPDCINAAERDLKKLMACEDSISGRVYGIVIDAIQEDINTARNRSTSSETAQIFSNLKKLFS